MQFSSPARRALIAVGAVIGFYVLAIIVMILLLLVPSALALFLFIKIGPSWSIACLPLLLGYAFLMGWFCVPAAIGIGVAIVPRLYPFSPPGPRLSATDQPALFAVLIETAKAAGQAVPSEVFLTPNIDASITEHGGIMGLGRRRAVGVGLPLLQLLSISEFRAILAHEFGHYSSGEVRLRPLIYETDSAIHSTLMSIDWESRINRTLKIGLLIFGPVEYVFSAYGRWFFGITRAIGREQEYSADSFAARTIEAEPLAQGLRKIHSAAPALEEYIRQEVRPVVNAGYRPRFAEGFARLVQLPNIKSWTARLLEEEISTAKADPYDTHPPLRNRLGKLASLAAGESLVDDRPAMSLLQNVPELEKNLLAYVTYRPGIAELPLIEWDDVGTVVFLPSYRKMLEEHGAALKGVTPSMLPDAVASTRFIDYLAGIREAEEDDEDPRVRGARFANHIIGAALVNLLIQRGWSMRMGLGSPDTLRLGEDSIEPLNIVPRLVDHSLTAEEWREECKAIGIADVDLGSVPLVIGQQTKEG